ncbi:MAG: triose-phosphate isomerase [Candidatus Gracilibacteria bacterium]|nr:triose-phosphate isomerase [Candidatus Gracilibacteria bacterium]
MKYLIGANFKMNKSTKELKEYLEVFKSKYACFLHIDLMIAPVTSGLGIASELLEGSCINLGSQNMYFEESGAYTGEISPSMLNELNCTYVIIGHSERRQYFNETNEFINKKVKAAISHRIRPILCIGESLEQKNKGLTKEVLKIQLIEGLWGVEDVSKVDIAYEPVWAIGTGETATPEYIEEIHDYIRELVGNDESRIIYGGSVKPDNSKQLISIKNVNGFLVGSASLDPESFLKIAEVE